MVPAYNAAKRIGRTLSSIVSQDHGAIEIIVVDDGSSDGTGETARDLLSNSGRDFRIIAHETNLGVSAARNSGLGSASGDYMIFFDADDIADPDYVSALLGAITENDGDAAFCGYRDRFEETGEEREIPIGLDPSRQYSAEELTVMFVFGKFKLAIGSAIFKKKFLDESGLKFAVGCSFGEDEEFLIKALSQCKKIGISAKCPYIYVHHNDMAIVTSVSTKDKFIRRRVDGAASICRAARYLAEHSGSPRVRDIAVNFIMAEGLIKTLTAAAMRNDAEEFYRKLYEPETRRALIASRRYLLQKPDVFVKAASMLIAPRTYFRIKSKLCE